LIFGLTKPTEKSRDGGRHLPIFGVMPIEKSSRILTENLSLRSAALGRIVQVDLYPPPAHSIGQMSLLLINDGQDLGRLGLAELLDDLYGRAALAPLLCVGIHTGPQRKMEYGTAAIPDYLGRGAMAGRYTAFVLDELLPRLEEQLSRLEERSSRLEERSSSVEDMLPPPKTARAPQFKDKAFAGFSLGALSAMDIVWNHPQVFNRAGLFSGSFWWRTKDKDDPGYRDETDRIMHRQVCEGSHHPGLRFFFECGTDDEREDRNNNGIIDSIDDTRDLIGELVAKGYDPVKDIRYLEITGGGHDVATWALAMPEFLQWGWGKAEAAKP
jgi:enterochelin esterase-like enzyme